VEPTTALGIQRWHFRGILESHPQIALALLPILTRRIRHAEGTLPEAHVRH
jgi:CRP-like cAMP-binding protein